MTAATLTIDLDAIRANWRALNALSAGAVETAAVVKAFGYGLDSGRVAGALAGEGVKTFFVATIEEGAHVQAAAPGADVYVFTGLMRADVTDYLKTGLIPLLNSAEQTENFLRDAPDLDFGMQLDTGMNRLGMEADELAAARSMLGGRRPSLVISHLACADEPDHPQNAAQLAEFRRLTHGWAVRRSLAATGGTLLGRNYHFDLCRPGVGLYGGLPFEAAKPVVRVSIPMVQLRDVAPGESVGYSAAWIAKRPSRIATLSAGYADGLIRALGQGAEVWAGDIPVPVVGRVSMDLLTVDVTDLDRVPEAFDILGPHQGIDDLGAAAGTIGYEILTALGGRYNREYLGA